MSSVTAATKIPANAQLHRFLARQQRAAVNGKYTISPLKRPPPIDPTIDTSHLPSPFLPRPGAQGRWKGPRVSIRTWKKLFIASNYGKDFSLPKGPKGKEAKLLTREEKRLEAIEEESELFKLAQQHWTAKTVASQSKTKTSKSSQLARPDLDQYLLHRGPYKGRKLAEGRPAFKGHKWQVKKENRIKDIEKRLERMPQQLAEFEKARAEKRAAMRPSLPF